MDDLISKQAAIAPIMLLPAAQQEQQHGRMFQEIVVEYLSISTYPEYEGKPYFSIKYTENGQEFIGYGTYKPEVLSEFLITYFMPSTQQWIPCRERPPEESGDYLVTVAHHSGELWVEVDQFDSENGSWWHYMDDVTAWMPRPEPYKRKQE